MDRETLEKLAKLDLIVQALTFETDAQKSKLSAHEVRIDSLTKELQDARDAEAQKEQKALMWGISTLGTFVLLLGGVVWNYRGVIFKQH